MSDEIPVNGEKNYKFKALNIYSSTEWLANNTKKYRQVFNEVETSYVYAELSFINKQFDRENWSIKVQLKCFEVGKKKQVCSLDFNKKVSPHDNVAYIREGWGNKKEYCYGKASKTSTIIKIKDWLLPQIRVGDLWQ